MQFGHDQVATYSCDGLCSSHVLACSRNHICYYFHQSSELSMLLSSFRDVYSHVLKRVWKHKCTNVSIAELLCSRLDICSET